MTDEGEVVARKRSKKVWIIVTAAAIFLVAAVSGGLLFYKYGVSHNPIPASIRANSSFPLYYPGKLPAGWKLDKSSFYTGPGGVVGYIITGPDGNLNITLQPKPASFDFNNFYTKQLSGTVQFLTPLGQGAVGKTDGRLVGSLTSSASWALASPSTNTVSESEIQTILTGLRQ